MRTYEPCTDLTTCAITTELSGYSLLASLVLKLNFCSSFVLFKNNKYRAAAAEVVYQDSRATPGDLKKLLIFLILPKRKEKKYEIVPENKSIN